MDPVFHIREIATTTQVELEGALLKTEFQSEVDRPAILWQQVGVTAWIPVEVIERRITVVMAVADGKANSLIERKLIGERRRRKKPHGFAVGPVVTGCKRKVGTVERLAVDGSIGRDDIATFLAFIVVAPHLLVVPLQLGLQSPRLVELLVKVGNLVQNKSMVLRVNKGDRVVGDRVTSQQEIALVFHEGCRLQLKATRSPIGLKRDKVA